MSTLEHDLANFERPGLTVDVVIFSLIDNQLQLLLVRRSHAPFEGQWALPGGFVQMSESLEEAAARQLEQKTGADDVYLEQLYTFGDLGRDPRMRVVTVAYFAVIPYVSAIQEKAAKSGLDTRWWSIDTLPDLAFDHHEIVEYATQRLRYKLEYTTVGFELLPDEFTLPELQQAYQIILGESLDKRNFRRKILAADILEETDRMRKVKEGRPARLYRYRHDAIAEVKTRRLFP